MAAYTVAMTLSIQNVLSRNARRHAFLRRLVLTILARKHVQRLVRLVTTPVGALAAKTTLVSTAATGFALPASIPVMPPVHSFVSTRAVHAT
jgi:hypothetical protein